MLLVGDPAATGDGVVDNVLPSWISSLSVLPHSWAV
jgi:hypothetical protein